MNPTFDPTDMPLRDIHLPDAVSWWPLAFGWWILVSIIFIGIIVFAIRFHAARRQRVARRGIQKVIDALHAGQNPVLCAQQVSTIMRRFAMTISDEPDVVAGLAGQDWLAFLDASWGGTSFTRGEGRLLLSAPYKDEGGLDQKHCLELGLLCMTWIKAQPVRI
jgi:hypothetical protein|tara:strand:- start:782 stop:1270 length:489 start_codon:yes stop_codon:yes gene_type:complete